MRKKEKKKRKRIVILCIYRLFNYYQYYISVCWAFFILDISSSLSIHEYIHSLFPPHFLQLTLSLFYSCYSFQLAYPSVYFSPSQIFSSVYRKTKQLSLRFVLFAPCSSFVHISLVISSSLGAQYFLITSHLFPHFCFLRIPLYFSFFPSSFLFFFMCHAVCSFISIYASLVWKRPFLLITQQLFFPKSNYFMWRYLLTEFTFICIAIGEKQFSESGFSVSERIGSIFRKTACR